MKRKVDWLAIATAALLAVSLPSGAADDEQAACATIEDNAERLACYDRAFGAKPEPAEVPEDSGIADRDEKPEVEEEQAVASAPPAAVVPEVEQQNEIPAVLSDEVGKETVKNRERETLLVKGRVVRCEKGRSGKYLFHFENGQIWRQKDSKRMSYRDCDFQVTISKDVFGYTLVRDGHDRVYRIERLR